MKTYPVMRGIFHKLQVNKDPYSNHQYKVRRFFSWLRWWKLGPVVCFHDSLFSLHLQKLPFLLGDTSSIRVHVPASYVSLPECTWENWDDPPNRWWLRHFLPPKPWGEDDQRLNPPKRKGPKQTPSSKGFTGSTSHSKQPMNFNGWRKMVISHHPPFQIHHGNHEKWLVKWFEYSHAFFSTLKNHGFLMDGNWESYFQPLSHGIRFWKDPTGTAMNRLAFNMSSPWFGPQGIAKWCVRIFNEEMMTRPPTPTRRDQTCPGVS